MTPTQRLYALQQELLTAQDRGMLTPQGERALQLLQSGVATQGTGAFLQGLTMNLSDEAIGSIRSFLSPQPAELSRTLQAFEAAGQPGQREVH